MRQSQVRQGDIFFEVVEARKDGIKKIHTPILAEGEVTGHAHKIISPSIEEIDMSVDTNGDIYVFHATKDIVVDHEEHGQITLAAGEEWLVTRQREFDPMAAEKERRVAD